LTISESQMMRVANSSYSEKFGNHSDRFCTFISNMLISFNPESDTEIDLNKDVLRHFTEVMGERVESINERYFKGHALLSIIGKNENIMTSEIVELSKEYEDFIYILMSAFSELVSFDKKSDLEKKDINILSIRDLRIVDTLRNEAIKLEKTSINDAYALMAAAKVLRPNGPVIVKKVDEYLGVINAGLS